jgi:uncharacterized protein (DUF1810 family)
LPAVPEHILNNIHNLERFVIAQHAIYQTVLKELRAGRKQSHWMWFIFPQIKGLGYSETARKFAISSLEEADAYLRHPILGARLRECTGLVANITGRTIEEIFGYPDHMKFHSSITLFALAADEDKIFKECLRKYFADEMDSGTLLQLGR